MNDDCVLLSTAETVCEAALRNIQDVGREEGRIQIAFALVHTKRSPRSTDDVFYELSHAQLMTACEKYITASGKRAPVGVTRELWLMEVLPLVRLVKEAVGCCLHNQPFKGRKWSAGPRPEVLLLRPGLW